VKITVTKDDAVNNMATRFMLCSL